jgi:hypothetical protein
LGQAPPISTDASALVGYHSLYENRPADHGEEEDKIDQEPLRLRGEAQKNEEVHKILSWTTMKGYKLLVGISLPIQDPVGGDYHKAQLWEEVAEELMFGDKQALGMYIWLSHGLCSRSTARALPAGMPDLIDDVTVETMKDGKAGYIMFTPRDSLATAMKKEPIQAVIEYEYGHMKVGMGEVYTIRMLANEFVALTHDTLEIYPKADYRRLIDGSVVHDVTTDRNKFLTILTLNDMIVPPLKILEERGRGTEIRSLEDMGKLLQYWAWAQLEIEVGVLVPDTKSTLEFWTNLKLQPLPDDEDPYTNQHELHRLWLEKLRDTSPTVAQNLETFGIDFGMRMRYLYNTVKAWFAPNASIRDGINRSLAEDPVPKDRWISFDITVYPHPTLPDDQVKDTPSALFGPGSYIQARYDDPEVQ